MDNNKRLASLDTLRGFDMLFITGFASLVIAICKLFPNGAECWIAQQMGHVDWNGLAHHDTIFPLFLFVAGISFPFSYAKQKANGTSRSEIYWKIFKRAFILVLFGLICNGLLKLEFETLRIPSVLGRIGLAWMFAALLFINFKPRTRGIIAVVLLVGYWFLCMIPAPDAPGADPLSQEGCLVGYVDRVILGNDHLYLKKAGFDPEGILSTLPAIVTAMLGMFTGELVRKKNISGNKKTLYLIGSAIILLVIGLIWSKWFPINKKLWTSTFVLVVAAYSLIMFAIFYWIIDVRGHDGKWTMFFRVIGMNSITIFMAPRIIDFRKATRFFVGGIIDKCPDQVGSVVYYACYIAVCWLFLYFLYRKKVFLKV